LIVRADDRSDAELVEQHFELFIVVVIVVEFGNALVRNRNHFVFARIRVTR
jgi:hypothetical protein